MYDFNKDSDLDEWRIVDDVVMVGKSSVNMELTEDGHGCFKREVSLEHNGGFFSVRHSFEK